VDDAIDRICHRLLQLGEREVSSRQIGEMVMNELAKLDKVAYVRFASVYRSFQDISEFSDAIKEIRSPITDYQPDRAYAGQLAIGRCLPACQTWPLSFRWKAC
jgi:transcriptional regulator NrdR family protein